MRKKVFCFDTNANPKIVGYDEHLNMGDNRSHSYLFLHNCDLLFALAQDDSADVNEENANRCYTVDRHTCAHTQHNVAVTWLYAANDFHFSRSAFYRLSSKGIRRFSYDGRKGQRMTECDYNNISVDINDKLLAGVDNAEPDPVASADLFDVCSGNKIRTITTGKPVCLGWPDQLWHVSASTNSILAMEDMRIGGDVISVDINNLDAYEHVGHIGFNAVECGILPHIVEINICAGQERGRFEFTDMMLDTRNLAAYARELSPSMQRFAMWL